MTLPDRPLTRELKLLFTLFATLAFIAGVLLFVPSGNSRDWFSWDIAPPLTAAFLGAAYWAAFVLLAWTATRRTWGEASATVVPVFLIAVLLLIATLIHLDKFDLDSLFGWFWLFAYILVPPAMLVLLWRQRGAPATLSAEPPAPVPGWLLALLLVQGAVMLAVGVALYVSPDSADTLWPWKLTPLTSRAVGAFVVGFGAAAVFAAWQADLRRLAGSAYAYTALGALELIAVARYPETLDAAGEAAYIAFTASVLAVGLAGTYLAQRAAQRQPASSSRSATPGS